MTNLAADWEAAKPVTLQADWDKATPVEPTAADRGKATLGGINRGIAGLAGMLVDTAENATNIGIAGYGAAKQAITGKPGPDLVQLPGASRDWMKLMEAAGIGTTNPRPDDPASRMLHTGGTIAGGSMLPGAGVRPALTAATSGAVAGEVLGPEWVGPAAMAPAAAGQAYGGVRNAVAAKAAPTVDTFKKAGAMPSVGQATDSTFLHGLENLAAKFPGGSGIMKSFIESQQQRMGAKARTGVSAEDAGRAVEKGITGEGGFLDRTKATWKILDDAVANKVPRGTEVAPVNTARALAEMTSESQGATATSKILTNPKLQEIYDAFKKDMAPPEVPLPGTEVPSIYKTIDKAVISQPQSRIQKTIETAATELHPHGYGQPSPPVAFPQTNVSGKTTMPYQTLRELRSKVGSMMDNALVTGIPSGEMKRLYGAISADLEAAAKQAGAGKEFVRQNNYYRARMGRIEDVLERVIGKAKQPEDIFKALNPTDPDQANKVRAVMRSLEPGERQVVSEAVANRLGRASPGKQDVYGELFSSETFLTNWNKLSPGAKAQFFPDPPLRENMDRIANAAGKIREGKGIYANPSGTAGSFAAYSIYASPIAAIATGSVAPLVAAGGASGAAYIGAKMLTNPKIVEWLAKPVNPSRPGEAQAHLARLGVIYNSLDNETKQEVAKFVELAGQQNQKR